jgi:protein-L-isoaspartate(D-aspartate) O-methyltransferase
MERRVGMDKRAELLREIEQEMRDTAHWTGRSQLSPRVAAAMGKVKREAFVAPGSELAAYENRPLSIGHDQTISQPFIVALMTELLDLDPADVVLEVGTGSGYQAAVLAELAREVRSIEIIPELGERAAIVLASQGYTNVALRIGDGALGWPDGTLFDAIIVTAAARDVPPALVGQLRPGGRMIIPIGPPYGEQELVLLRKHADTGIERRKVLSVAFVPLTGERRD